MGYAIQVGLVAAFVVVFLPLGMAGLHLTRNRLLFFSVGLFITLAVSVHLSPYFPSASMVLSALMSNHATTIVGQSTCVSHLHELTWEDGMVNIDGDDSEYDGLNHNSTNSCMRRRLWSWNENASTICAFQHLNRTDALQLLKGSWILVAGDSQTRLFLLALMDHLFSSSEFVRDDLFKRHANYSFHNHQIKLDFVWAPYVSDLTNMVLDLRDSRNYPDVLVMADGLWHMLHVTNASDYFISLVDLHNAVYSLFPVSYFSFLPTGGQKTASISRVPQMFWVNVPYLVNSILNTEQKRLKLTNQLCTEYDGELISSKILKPEGPLALLDLYRLSKGCGVGCTIDGMHYCNIVYEAVVQIMLNELLIATQQAPSK